MGGIGVLERRVGLSTLCFPSVCNNDYYTMEFLLDTLLPLVGQMSLFPPLIPGAVRSSSNPLPCCLLNEEEVGMALSVGEGRNVKEGKKAVDVFLFDRGHKGEKADKGNNGFLFEGEACVVSFCFLDGI